MYTLRHTFLGDVLIRDADQANIPNDPTNVDWCAYQEWLSAGNSPTVAVEVPAVPQRISRRQLLIGLAAEGYLTADEAVAAAATGAVPAVLVPIIAALPADQQIAAKITWASMQDAEINDPLLLAALSTQGKTMTDLASFFTKYAST